MQNIDILKFIPEQFKKEEMLLPSIIKNAFNKMLTSDNSYNVNGIIGKNDNSGTSHPIIPGSTLDREVNALDVGFYYKHGTEEKILTFQDLINKLQNLGVDLENIQSWFTEISYNYLPPINLDKFSNFSSYFWIGHLLNKRDESLISWNPSMDPEYYVIERGDYKSDFKRVPVDYVMYDNDISHYLDSNNKLFGLNNGTLIPGQIIAINSLQNKTLNGFYIASSHIWERAIKGSPEDIQGYSIFYSIGNNKCYRTIKESNGQIYFIVDNSIPSNITSEWETYNFWVHKKDIETIYKKYGIYIEDCIQASRPIIEYSNKLELNSSFDHINGSYIQKKFKFNQIPQFNVYRVGSENIYGTSGIFYYKEDQNNSIDEVLQKRISFNSKNDFMFEVGLFDNEDGLLFYNDNGFMYNIWRGLLYFPESITNYYNFISESNNILSSTKTLPFYISLKPNCDSQTWVLKRIHDNSNEIIFSVIGSNSGLLSDRLVINDNTYFECDDFILTLDNSINHVYDYNDEFSFTTFNDSYPRFVRKNNNVIENYKKEDGETLHNIVNNIDGVFKTPSRLFQNVVRSNNKTISYSDLSSHFRSIMKSQEGFEGSIYSDNNFRLLEFVDTGLGGHIKEFSNNISLFLGLTLQEDVSIISLLDFAEHQYNVALSSIDSFINDNLIDFISKNPISYEDLTNSNSTTYRKLNLLFDYYQSVLLQNNNLSNMYKNNTLSTVKNWISTPSILGLVPCFQPEIFLDLDFNALSLKHHDGHISILAKNDDEFNSKLVDSLVQRLDGNKTGGIRQESIPSLNSSYIGQLWFKPSTNELKIFNIDYQYIDNILDEVGTPASVGLYTHKFGTNEIYESIEDGNGILTWVLSNINYTNFWKDFDVAQLRNSLLVFIENKLYNESNKNYRSIYNSYSFDSIEDSYLKFELSNYALKHKYDLFTSNYIEEDPFTWNYNSLNISLGPNEKVPGRWSELYKKYTKHIGITNTGTQRPDLEPWKYLGFETKPINWDQGLLTGHPFKCQYELDENNLFNIDADVVYTSNLSNLSGLKTIDDVNLIPGSIVLLSNQTNTSYNGLWEVSNSTWVKVATFNGLNKTCKVLSGTKYSNTYWIISGNNNTISQIRLWNKTMWDYIKNVVPGIKVCVNIYNDELLPPYVEQSNPCSIDALTNTIPSSANKSYEYGDGSVVELFWKKSPEYIFGALRSLFRKNPFEFISKTWGDIYYIINMNESPKISYDTNRIQRNKDIILHNEKISNNREYNLTNETLFGSLSITDNSIYKLKFIQVFEGQFVYEVYKNNSYLDKYLTGRLFSDFNNSFRLKGQGNKVALNDEIIFDKNGIISINQTQYKHLRGIGQYLFNYCVSNNIDIGNSEIVSIIKNIEPKLIHRLGTVIDKDSLSLHNQNGDIIDENQYSLLFKKSEKVKSIDFSALRIQLLEIGSKIIDNNFYVPLNKGEDWKFRIETYNKFKSTIDTYNLDVNGSYETFSIIDSQITNETFKNYTNKIGNKTTLQLPMEITGIQNLINILFGYKLYLEENNIDTSNSAKPIFDKSSYRVIDWQFEIEKLVETIYGGMSAGNAFTFNPFISSVSYNTPIGIFSPMNKNMLSNYYNCNYVYDVLGDIINVNNLVVDRTDDKTTITSEIPIFGGQFFTDEYEHVLVFESLEDAPFIYNQQLGLKSSYIYADYVRSKSSNLKPTYDGFIINKNGNTSKNVLASIDSIGDYYDVRYTFRNPLQSKHALSLFGYNKKEYMDNLGIADSSQFNFWRGLIQSKGTNTSINAFVNYTSYNEANIDEYWAFKVATYGDNNERNYPEIRINPEDVIHTYTKFHFKLDKSISTDINYNKPNIDYISINQSDVDRWFNIDDSKTEIKFDSEKLTESISSNIANTYVKLTNIYHYDTIDPRFNIKIYDSNNVLLNNSSKVKVISSTLVKIIVPGTYFISGYTWGNPLRFSPIKLIDFKNKIVEENIQLWNPAIGIHSNNALDMINIVSKNNPALVNYTPKQYENINYNKLKSWGKSEVGTVWWDISNLSYIPYYDSNVYQTEEDKISRWGMLSDWSSIDLYEWVESNVHPSKYNEVSLKEAGDASKDKNTRTSGEVALEQYYYRDRIIYIKPIAWSKSSNGGLYAHPAFGESYTNIKIYNTGYGLILSSGRCEAIGFKNDIHFSGWNNLDNKPIGEVKLNGTKNYVIGSENNVNNISYTSNGISSLNRVIVESNKTNTFGDKIGKILLTTYDDSISGLTYVKIVEDSSGDEEEVLLNENSFVNNILTLHFSSFGIKVKIVRKSSTTLSITELKSILNSMDVYIREGMYYDNIITLSNTEYINSDEYLINGTFESSAWRSYSIPSTSDLSNDLDYPHNQWKAYEGDSIAIIASKSIIDEMKKEGNLFTLNNGTIIKRYESSWSKWNKLNDYKIEKISDGENIMEVSIISNNSLLDSSRLYVYVNGIQINSNQYDIIDSSIKFKSILKEGYIVSCIYKHYIPTSKDLSFNPEVSDDLNKQIHYKVDYEYTFIDDRDLNGNITSTKYYYWVKNKSIASKNKSLSLLEAESLLKNGPTSYMLFSRLVGSYYDSCILVWNKKLISKNDTYKLRFMRDFTLTLDDEEMTRKSVHNEWTLIRRNQKSKIPLKLWNLIVDSICGEDINRNSLPFQSRIDYDLRNKTNTIYGFENGQILLDSDLAKKSIIDSLLNTNITIKIFDKEIIDSIPDLDLSNIDSLFVDALTSRETMNIIWSNAKPQRINEIVFNFLELALAKNFDLSDIFKTSLISLQTKMNIETLNKTGLIDDNY